ncbi:Alpha-glucosidase [Ferrimonas balearica DSM 9799]|uniref:Alpha-glucosidase n=1 Tax=Ferrimonas balearica (strain DSM 9799 / CCM 4581 / KCTC 23876 / PAT) TaxID=550540 RepID=E1SVG2_FERBD|nr:TIM-barrel domain-containing protein [Ferrimonas balearica]ADN75308.1 Alpha-glucosidase [Ferrimonas balearica DSM 9799]
MKRILTPLAASLALALCAPGLAATLTGHHFDGRDLVLTTDEGTVTLTGYGEGALAVHYQQPGVKQLPSFAIDEQAPRVAGKLVRDGAQWQYQLPELTALIDTAPFKLSFVHHGEVVLAEEHGLFVHDNLRGFRFALEPQEKLVGGGQRVLGMDRRGHRLPLYNKASYGYTTHAEQMYYGLPAVLSSNQYALVFDNSATGWIDLGKTESDVLQFEAQGGRTAYLVAAGSDYPEVIENLTAATGRQPLPPRWALGNYASRFGYHTEQEARDTVAKFRDEDYPLDAIVLDLYWFGKDVQGHMGNLAWDYEAWPTPEQMIADFQADGVNTILITEPFVLTTSKRWQEAVDADALAQDLAGKPKTFDFYFGNTGLIDVFAESGQQWFWNIYQGLMEQGVAGWWGDLGEPEVHPHDTIHAIGTADEVHNAYGHQWARMVYEGLRQAQPDQRPMIMMRSGFVGSQRYGMIPWTGDVSRSWGGLQPQVELSLQMGLLGLGYTHSDLGGFAGGEQFDAEMYTRWMQYGVFQPVYRPHAQENIAPEPVFHDKATRDILRDWVKLRYRMLPYNYTLAYQNSTTGMPLMRPLMFEAESDLSWFDNKDAYLWGDAFLVAPVVQPGVTEVAVALPEGVWFNYFSGQRHEGGRTVSVPVTLETLPVLVRAGSFVPMVAPMRSTADYSSAELTLHYYHDDSVTQASGEMYEDDGRNPDALVKGEYQLLTFSAEAEAQGLTINLQRRGDYPGAPQQRTLDLQLHHLVSAPQSVTVDGTAVPFQWQDGVLSVPVRWQQARHQVVVR